MAYDKKLGYDPDIKDYSALIANTTDASTRAALLEQRQNKLNHLESTGGRDAQWADNSVVSTWTSTYQPGGWNDDTASYNPYGGSQGASLSPALSGMERAHTEYRTMLEDQYESSAKAQQQAVQASVDKGVAALRTQARDVNDSYDNLARQAYIAYMNDTKQMPYRLSASGLTGGATESAMVSLGTSYQETLGQNERERLSALRQIDSEIAQLVSTGDMEKAQAAADNASQYASALSDIYRSLISARQNEAQSIAQNAYRQQQLSAEAQQREYERQLEIAQILARAGDFSGFARLGVDTAALEQAYREQQAGEAKSTGTGARSTAKSDGGASSGQAQAAAAQDGGQQALEALVQELLREGTQGAQSSAAVLKAARTYVQELLEACQNDTLEASLQIGRDYQSNFISQDIASAALQILFEEEA